MSAYARFDCPSSILDLKALLRRARNVLWAGLFLALGVHLSLTQVRKLGEVQKATKPLTTQFVKRAPRLTKPLEMKKRPQPRRRMMRRKMVALQAKVNRRQLSSRIRAARMIQSLAKPQVAMGRSIPVSEMGAEPETLAEQIMGMKETKDVVDMSLELVDIEVLDTGKYQAMVIQDPNDRENIRGFFHFVYVSPLNAPNRSYGQWEDRVRQGIRRLIERLREWTAIQADIWPTISYDSAKLFETPWVYGINFVGAGWIPTDQELANIGAYMLSGGFYYVEGGMTDHSRSRRIKGALATQRLAYGRDYTFERLSHDHPLYHCYYDFPDGPPIGSSQIAYGIDQIGEPYVRGIVLDNRLITIYNNSVYVTGWGEFGRFDTFGWGKAYANHDGHQQIAFGINTIIFALTQEGSITKRVMDSVGY